MLKAFRITQAGWDGLAHINVAETRGKAIHQVLIACREAGYKADWLDFRAVRLPEYDGLAVKPGCIGSTFDGWNSGCLVKKDTLL